MKDRLFRGYGPLIGFTALFLAVVLLVPSKAPEEVDPEGGDVSGVLDMIGEDGSELRYDEDGNLIDPETGEVDPTVAGAADSTGSGSSGSTGGSGSGSSGGSGSGGGSGTGNGAAGGNAAGGANKGPTKVAGCGGVQVKGDPYSPPCVQFSGSNGGATHRGVSDSEIVVTVRIDGFDSGLVDAVTKAASTAGKIPSEPREKVERTITGLVEYFNQRFQFYGRKIKMVIYDGKGDPLNEIIGNGQEGARADAVKVAKEIGAFADVSAITAPYASSLASEGVINVGAPYVPRDWLTQRRPYSWTPLTDCTTVVEATSSYYATKMFGKPAVNAQGALKDKPRRLVVVAPENKEYQDCVSAGIAMLNQRGAGSELVGRYEYKIDVNNTGTARDVATKLVADEATTLMCGCDPVFLNYLAQEIRAANISPEMIMVGVALVDTDLVGQLFQQDVWRNAFGISFQGATAPQRSTIAYAAYKAVRNDEPSITVDILYNQLYMLAIGIQMAGPDLNPLSFEKGMFSYPKRSGPYGSWGFGPNDYSTSDDVREVFWNPGAQSVFNRAAGAYQNPNGDARFPIGKWPGGQPRAAG